MSDAPSISGRASERRSFRFGLRALMSSLQRYAPFVGAVVTATAALGADTFKLHAAPEVQIKLRSPISSVAFSPDGKRLAIADVDGGISLWAINNRKKLWASVLPSAGAVSEEQVALAFTCDGTKILLASDVRDPLVLDSGTGKVLRTIGRDGFWLAAAVSSWCKDGTTTAVTSSNDDLHFWNPLTGNVVMALRGAGYNVVSLQVPKDAGRIALGLSDGRETSRLIVRELPSGRTVFDVRQSDISLVEVALTPNGEHIVGAFGEELACWSINSKERLWSIRADECRGLAVSPDGRTLAHGTGSKFLLRDLRTGNVDAEKRYGRTSVNAVAFAADGAALAIGTEDGAVAVWKSTHRPDRN